MRGRTVRTHLKRWTRGTSRSALKKGRNRDWTGAHAGWVTRSSELRKSQNQRRRRCQANRKATLWRATEREYATGAAESKTLGMHGNFTHENRETLSSSVAERRRIGGRKRRAIRPACTTIGSRTVA